EQHEYIGRDAVLEQQGDHAALLHCGIASTARPSMALGRWVIITVLPDGRVGARSSTRGSPSTRCSPTRPTGTAPSRPPPIRHMPPPPCSPDHGRPPP